MNPVNFDSDHLLSVGGPANYAQSKQGLLIVIKTQLKLNARVFRERIVRSETESAAAKRDRLVGQSRLKAIELGADRSVGNVYRSVCDLCAVGGSDACPKDVY